MGNIEFNSPDIGVFSVETLENLDTLTPYQPPRSSWLSEKKVQTILFHYMEICSTNLSMAEIISNEKSDNKNLFETW